MSRIPIDGSHPADGRRRHDIEIARKLLGDRISFIDVSTYLSDFAANNGRLGLSTDIPPLLRDRLSSRPTTASSMWTAISFSTARSRIWPIPELKAPLLAAHDIPSYFDMTYRRRLPLRPGAPKFKPGVLMFNMPLVRSGGLLASSRRLPSTTRTLSGLRSGCLERCLRRTRANHAPCLECNDQFQRPDSLPTSLCPAFQLGKAMVEQASWC